MAPNVLDRRFDGWLPDRAWVADITYLRTDEGWLYLACVMDLGSRRIVGWSMRDHMRANLVCDALTSAYWSRRPATGPTLPAQEAVPVLISSTRALNHRS